MWVRLYQESESPHTFRIVGDDMGRPASKLGFKDANEIKVIVPGVREVCIDALETLRSLSLGIASERERNAINRAVALVENANKTLHLVATRAEEVLNTPITPASDRAGSLVKWFKLGPTVERKFRDTMNALRKLPPGEFMPLAGLVESLAWRPEVSQEEQRRETEGSLRGMSKVNMLVRLAQPGSEPSYALSEEARALIERGVFASLGVPGTAETKAS